VWYWRIRKEANDVEGLITSLIAIENWRTFFTISFWTRPTAVLQFNSKVFTHIVAANSSFRYLERGKGGAELWSAEFRLNAVSQNFRWAGVNIEKQFL
jgi:hypothetical protein